jgi:long-chain acyl-CoA synthetase
LNTLVEFVREYGAHGGEIAVRQRRGYRIESWSYARIAAEANRVARELEARGLNQGDAVLLWGENSAEWIIAFFGCLLRGAVVVPLDAGSPLEFAQRVSGEVEAQLVFHGAAQKECAWAPSIALKTLTELAARHDATDYPSPAGSRQDTLEIIFTSGATAEPRGVVISHGNVLANIEPLRREIQKYLRYEKVVHPIRFLDLLPLSHVFGQMLGVFIPPLLGGTVVFMDALRPAEFTETMQRERISVVVTVPRFMESLRREVERSEEGRGGMEQFRRNLAAGEKEHFLRRWWRFRRVHARLGWKFWAFISGGAALSAELETFWNRLGYAVIQGYGMTETTSLISLNHPFRSSRGSIGRVFPGIEVRVEEDGEILVRGENVATAYRQGGANHSLAEGDGWFHTGDVAEKDTEGRLYFRGRQKNVIVTSAGMNIYPEDVEKALRAQNGVRDCVVVGVARARGDEPYAVLLMDANTSDAAKSHALRAVDAANRSLAEFQRVRQWMVWPETDFPRTPTQKPIVPKIREAVVRAQSAEGGNTAGNAQGNDNLSQLITQITGRNVAANSPDGNIENDLGLSSLDRVELISALEERYQVDLNGAQFQDVKTVKQLENLLATGATGRVQYPYPTWPQNALVTVFRLFIYYLLAWPATYLLAAPRIRGRENLRDVKGPVLVIANHVTYLDIAWVLPALPARLRHRLATAMRGELLAEMRRPPASLGFLARALERLNYFLVCSLFNVFPLPKQAGFLQSFHFAGDLVDRRWSILVFPEGLTSEDGTMAAFRGGIGVLARQLNIPVVPMYLNGLFPLKRENRIFARPGQVRVNIGPPLEFSPEQDAAEITRILEQRVRELQSAGDDVLPPDADTQRTARKIRSTSNVERCS